ncbi:MAG: class I SAM-dependent methyltransferase [Bryobacteraceae bacterium]
MNPLKRVVHQAGRWYIRQICKSEEESQSFSVHNERPIEFRFALQALSEHRPKTILDVGTGTTAWPHLLRNCGFLVTATDNVRDYWPEGMVNRHWHVHDVDILKPDPLAGKQFDAVTCISVLEHIRDQATAMRNMTALVKPGGHLILTTPYAHSTPDENVYRRPDALYGQTNPYPCRSHSKAEFEGWLAMGLSLEKRELWQLFDGPVWATGKRVPWQQAQSENELHQLGCFLFRKK